MHSTAIKNFSSCYRVFKQVLNIKKISLLLSCFITFNVLLLLVIYYGVSDIPVTWCLFGIAVVDRINILLQRSC